MMVVYDELIDDLLNIKAVQIKTDGFFTLTSGLKSPIYCDNRLTMSYPEIRKKIAQIFKEKIRELDLNPDVIVGCATAGIPHAAVLSEELNLPMAYVRSSKKSHGKENLIEGMINKGDRVIVVEDLISTGGSALQVTDALEACGAEVLSVFAIFTYGFQRAIEAFEKKSFPLYTITSFDHLLEKLERESEVSADQIGKLKNWRDEL